MKLSWNMQPMLVMINWILIISELCLWVTCLMNCHIRTCKCIETSSANQREILWCDICRLISVGWCHSCGGCLSSILALRLTIAYLNIFIYLIFFNFRKLEAQSSLWNMEEWMYLNLNNAPKKGGFLVITIHPVIA